MNDELTIIDTFKNVDLVQITEDRFCVRRRFKSFFGKDKIDYFCLNLNGIDLTFDSICTGITVGSFERCRHVFNANALRLGKV